MERRALSWERVMKKFRWASRCFWLGALWLSFGNSVFAVDAIQIQAATDRQLQPAITALQTWVAIPSVTDATDSHRADKTRLLLDIVAEAKRLGFQARLVADQQVAIIDFDQQEPVIGILVHADVVPAGEEAGWQHPPFSGLLVDGAVWGRGAADDKGPIAATLYALAAIKEMGIKLAGGVRVIVGTSEENMRWNDFVAVGKLGLVPAQGWTADAAFPVVHAEKSFINAVVSFTDSRPLPAPLLDDWAGGTAPNSIPARATVWVRRDGDLVASWMTAYSELNPRVGFAIEEKQDGVQVTALGKAGHGSRPDSGVNAITHLARMLTAGAKGGNFAGSFTDGSAAGRTLQFLSKIIGGATDGGSLGIDRTHSVMGSTTVNVGQVVTDSEGVHSYLNIRGPIGLSTAQIEAALVEAVAPLSGRVDVVAAMDPLWVDPDDPFVQELVSSYRRWVDDDRAPLSIGGTTYAKAFPGYVAFGMGFLDEHFPVHAPNERLPVELLQKGIAIYVDAILTTVGVREASQ
ncbi:MAG: hypothetical protein DRQ52_04305 [Gammaproteobacteria bacterium]|nr:MAG: hypothetical protein DRQ52_04305 [Gammaproteobacteria bacterium]